MQLIVKDRRPLSRFFKLVMTGGPNPEARAHVLYRRIGMLVETSMGLIRRTRTKEDADREYQRRVELFEHWAAEISGDNKFTFDRAVDYVGHCFAEILSTGRCPEPTKDCQSWAGIFDTVA